MSKKIPGQGKPVRKKESSWLMEDVKPSTGLPPQVYGQVRCFLKLSVSQVVWTVPKPPDLALVRVKWWGEEGDGVLFRPFDVKKGKKAECHTTARYPVRSGPCQFATYLNDMGGLTLDLLTGPNSDIIGQAVVSQIGQLTNTRPINGFFPVVSASGQKLANLQVSIVLEPLLASYDNMGSIPTTDIMENRSYDSMVLPANSQPSPYTDLPTRPDSKVFISPTSVHDDHKGQTELGKTSFDGGLRQQLNYGLPSTTISHQHPLGIGAVAITTNGDVVSLPESRTVNSGGGLTVSNIATGDITRNKGMISPTRKNNSVDKDILSILVEKGTKLREAMIVTSMHADANTYHSNIAKKANSEVTSAFAPLLNPAEVMAPLDELIGPSKSALDILLTSPIKNQDFHMYKLMNGLSPGSSMSSDMGYDHMSDLEDPMHDNSIIHELFYHNSDNEGLGLSDVSIYDRTHKHHLQSPGHQYMSLPARLPGGSGGDNPLQAAGNQRPPSRTSSLTSLNVIEPAEDDGGLSKKKKTKRRARSRSRSSTRSNSQTRSTSIPSGNSDVKSRKAGGKDKTSTAVVKDPKSLKLKKKARSRSSSRSRSWSRPRRRKSSVDMASDSDRLSSVYSDNKKDLNESKQDGLSVERLTLLGRVHVARVNIDSLQLLKADLLDTSDTKLSVNKFRTGKPPRTQKSKKLCTYFVEYQFPVVTASRDRYMSSAIASEVTRIASKNIKDGAVIFNHRSVFPILFDGAAVERWWKSALVFRLYCREAGQQTPALIGSGGISLKSVLRSANLCVQREIEILDTRENFLHNSSRASSLNSSVSGRSSASVFGNLKVCVELASDHKEFPTMMARTKLAEMGENVKIIPIDGVPTEQVRLVEQLNRNKDQPVIKSPTKKIDIPGTVSQPVTLTAVTGLPPQSPRRKTAESTGVVTEETDEISKLKQQLKATLAVLSNSSSQKNLAVSHLDSGSHLFGEQREIEATTLHTLLFIQEGRDITLRGVPPLHMVNKYPGMLQTRPEATGRDSMTRNTYLVCRMFWTNDAVHSDVCWGTLNPEYNFLQIAPVLMTTTLLERMRDNYMIVEVWDKKVSSENDKLIGMVKLSLHQFYLSFRERKIANALLKSEYPVMAADNYMPIVDPFSGLHFGQLKVVLAMGSESQIVNFQRLALGSSGTEPVKPSSYLERQDMLKEGHSLGVSGKSVEHQFEIVVEGLRGLKFFESMIWGEADCFVQFFFPSEGEQEGDGTVSIKSIPTMKCFRTATTLCIPDPTFHDTFRRKLTLPVGVPVQRELLTACANSGGSVTGLPFEVWCRYYHPNVRDQLIAKCTLPLAKLCAMVTMHKSNEPCVQSFSLRLSQVGVNEQDGAETSAKFKDAGILDVTVNYKYLPAVTESALKAVSRSHVGSHVCLSVGIIRAAGLKAAADSIALLDPSMAYPADVGVNAYVRINISILGKENERVTKTVARSFAPEFNHWMDFPCPLLMSEAMTSDAISLAELLESAEAVFEVWHQIPTGLKKDFYVEKSKTDLVTRKLAHQTGDVLLGTAVVPLVSLLTRRTGLNGWFAINLPSLGWTKLPDDQLQDGTALHQVVGGLELSIRFVHQEDRERVISVARSVGWSPVDVDVEQADWQHEESHHKVHSITVNVDQVSLALGSALITGQTDLDPLAKCYIRYKLYDKGAVVSRSRKLVSSDGSLHCSLDHKHNFMLSHTAPLQWYLREERLEVQVWVTYGLGKGSEKKPRQRDKLIGSCYIDLESLADNRHSQQRISGLFPLFKPGASNLKAAFVKAHVVSKVCSSATEQSSEVDLDVPDSEVSVSASESEHSSDVLRQSPGSFTTDKSPRKRKAGDPNHEASFGVVLSVERAMHLPRVTERNRSGEINPTTYVSFQSAERSKPTCSCIFPNSVNPVWDYTVETRLSTEYLYKENKNLVLKVWHKPSEAKKNPDKSSDRVLGFVSVDLSSLTKGLQQICGWYNIMDFSGQCRGQIKVSITPLDMQGVLPVGSAGSSFMLPTLISRTSTSENTRAVASSIAQQLVSLQQQVMERMGTLSGQNVAAGVADTTSFTSSSQDVEAVKNVTTKDQVLQAASSSTTSHWQPKFVPEVTMDNPSKSYLFSSLRRQLQDLDTITQRLKNRLAAPVQKEDASENLMSTSHSGDILTGTQSDLSTIHTTSVLMNTRENSEPNPYVFSFEVGTSQESARSHTINNSSGLEYDGDSVRMHEETSGNQGHKLLDSGVFSAKNFSEKSDVIQENHSIKNSVKSVTGNGTLSGQPSYSTFSQDVATAGTLEARFLALAVANPQTVQSTVENSVSLGNSHGFVPHTQRSTVTESFNREMTPRKCGSNDKVSSDVGGADSGSEHVNIHSGSGSARSDNKTIEEKAEGEDYSSEDEEVEWEGHKSERFGSYHRYRELLDEEEIERDDKEEDDVADETEEVEVIPRSLNNISMLLALGTGVGSEAGKINDENFLRPALQENKAGQERDNLVFSPASPNVNVHEGTSIWCSEDNDETFFHQVFEKNRHLMIKTGENVDELRLDSWLLEQSNNAASKARLEDWLEVHTVDKSRRRTENGVISEQVVMGNVSGEPESMLKCTSGHVGHQPKSEVAEGVTQREEIVSNVCEEDTKLHLASDSEQEDEDSNVWNQNIENSSDEETSRNFRTDKQMVNGRVVEHEKQTINKLKDLHLQKIVAEVEFDKETDKLSVPSHGFKSLLSNVELLESVAFNTHNGQASHSTDALGSVKTGQVPHSAQSISAAANENMLQATVSQLSTLSSDHTRNGEYPFTLELSDMNIHNQYIAQGARPKVHNLLSNVDLQTTSTPRPNSEISHESEASTQSQKSQSSRESKVSLKSKTNSMNSGESSETSKTLEINEVSKKSGQVISSADRNTILTSKQHTLNNQELDQGISRIKSDVLIQGNSITSSLPKNGRNDRDSTIDSAYIDGDCSDIHSLHPSSLVKVNGHASTDDMPEDSGVVHDGTIINGDHSEEGSSRSLPNFFMSEKDMKASIRALQMATAAASVNKDKLRSENKVKAVSELVSKMTSSRVTAPAVSVKNKQPPSAEEAKRIAKIFSSKIS